MTRLQLNLEQAGQAKAEQARKERLAVLEREERDQLRSYLVVFLAGFAVGLVIGTAFALAFLS